MKFATGMLLLMIVLIAAIGSLLGQNQDLSGTWIGSTAIPNREDRDNLTLVLKKDGASYTGNITDSMGMLNATVLEKVKLEKDTLSFEFLVTTESGQIRVRSTLKVGGEKLVGSWESEQGDTGGMEMVRKK
jgi:hypothetical protein